MPSSSRLIFLSVVFVADLQPQVNDLVALAVMLVISSLAPCTIAVRYCSDSGRMELFACGYAPINCMPHSPSPSPGGGADYLSMDARSTVKDSDVHVVKVGF